MQSAKLDILIQEGATFTLFFEWYEEDTDESDPMDLTGYTARMKIKRTIDSEDTIIDLTTENSRITLGGTLGTIVLEIDAADTEGLDFDLDSLSGVYDLELVSGTTINRILQGKVLYSRQVTTTDTP